MPTVFTPPVSTYKEIATYTVTGSPDAEVVFSSIPATYRDLVLVLSGTRTGTGGPVGLEIYFNNDQTAGNYSHVYAIGFSGGPLSGTGTNIPTGIGISQTSIIFNIMDYSATDKHTTLLSRYNAAGEEVGMSSGRWANTAAVNEVRLKDANGIFSLAIGSTFSLYGIAG